MTKIDFENDRMQSVEQIDSAKRLSDKVLELKDLEDEITNAEESLKKLKDYNSNDYLLLTGDPAIIGVACSIVSDITNGEFNLLKWDKQERRYYPVEIKLYNKC